MFWNLIFIIFSLLGEKFKRFENISVLLWDFQMSFIVTKQTNKQTKKHISILELHLFLFYNICVLWHLHLLLLSLFTPVGVWNVRSFIFLDHCSIWGRDAGNFFCLCYPIEASGTHFLEAGLTPVPVGLKKNSSKLWN